MKNDLINYWLFRAVSSSQPATVYEFFDFAVQTFYDDPVSVQWLYEQVEAENKRQGGAK